MVEHCAVAIAAISGVLAARGKEVDLFGVIVLALVTAFGDGTIRDLMLGADHVFWIDGSGFLLSASLAAVVVFYLVRFHEMPVTLLMVADAFALALLTMSGARKRLAFGVATRDCHHHGGYYRSGGGHIARFVAGPNSAGLSAGIYLYATAAFFGTALFVLLHFWSGNIHLNTTLGIAATLLLRLAGIRWRIGLPLLRPRHMNPLSDREPVSSKS